MQVTKNAVALAIALATVPAFSNAADARSRHYGHYGHHGHYGHGHYGHSGHFGYPGAFVGGFAAGALLGAFSHPYYGYGYAPRYYYPPPVYYYPPPGHYYDEGGYYNEGDYYGGYYGCAPGGVVSRPANAIC
jgi:hypothetical protein